ncbi:hypothetical protein BT67DRAFT_32547 [Trichocladium antarcticum]|uniref:ribonuclease H n=1 Tax=Trichocladium antarcticum TaxID=1450529 RepID=A0AAN6ZD35_9PEZI|nr:hypothetical protein BT67DRAFT_32547 [Trichocladium antarcticum]
MPSTDRNAAPASTAEPSSRKRKMDATEQKYYAVRAGHKPGIYTSWAICQQQISGFKGALFKSFLSYEDASAFAAGRDPPSTKTGKPARFYGVAVGRKPGVYTDWPKAQEAIVGWKGPKYKKFDTRTEAEAFVRSYGTAATAARVAPDPDAGRDSEEPPAKRAKKVAVHPPPRGNVDVLYTDGSSLGNGKVGATAGVGVYFGQSDPRLVFWLPCATTGPALTIPSPPYQEYLGAAAGRGADEPARRAHGHPPWAPDH